MNNNGSEYFMMDCWGLKSDEPLQVPLNELLDDYDEIDWIVGCRFKIELPSPIEMQWDTDTVGGGLAWNMYGESSIGLRNEDDVRRLWAYPVCDPPLYHHDLIDALRESGVDNFDSYSTRIVDTKSGTVCNDYFAVNFIGLVKSVDVDKSILVQHSEDGLIDTDFDSVVLNESAIIDLKLFRLAECVTGLVVHGKVKEHLESKGGFGMTFTKPENWIG